MSDSASSLTRTIARQYDLFQASLDRLLITVGSMFNGVESPSVVFNPDDVIFPLTAGVELFSDNTPDAPQNDKLRFRVAVVLNETGIVDNGAPLVAPLAQQAKLVEGIVTTLTPRLK